MTVTVWGVFQLPSVKVSVLDPLSVEPLREFSVASSPVMATVTSAVGWASRTTVNVEVSPASVVRRLPDPSVAPVWAIVMPGGGVMWIETDCQVFATCLEKRAVA